MLKIFTNVTDRSCRDADGNPFELDMPRIFYKNTETVCWQLVTDMPDFNPDTESPDTAWPKYTGYSGATGIAALLTADSNYVHKIQGALSADTPAGSIASITVDYQANTASFATIPSSGTLVLRNMSGESEPVQYTARTFSNAFKTVTYTLEEGTSLTNSYLKDDEVDCDEEYYMQATLDTVNSNVATGRFVFTITAYSEKLRQTIEYANISAVPAAGLELAIYQLDTGTNTVIDRQRFVLTSFTIGSGMADTSSGVQLTEQREDETLTFMNALLASGFAMQFSPTATDADFHDAPQLVSDKYFRFRSAASGGTWSIPVKMADQAYVYIGYASSSTGDDFSLTPGANLTYIAILSTNTYIATPSASDFTGLWHQYTYIPTIDSTLDTSSANPVENQAIANAINGKYDILGVSSLPTASATTVGRVVYLVSDSSFYEGISTGTSPNITYSWTRVSIGIDGIATNEQIDSRTSGKLIGTDNLDYAVRSVLPNGVVIDSASSSVTLNSPISSATNHAFSFFHEPSAYTTYTLPAIDQTGDTDYTQHNICLTVYYDSVTSAAFDATSGGTIDWANDIIPPAEYTSGDVCRYMFTYDNMKEVWRGGYLFLHGTDPNTPEFFTVDSALNSSSTNPVQNAVVTSAIGGKIDYPVSGGNVGDFLAKTSDGVAWVAGGSGGGGGTGTVTWGGISGTISNQTDLQNELNSRMVMPSGGSAGQFLRKTTSGYGWDNGDPSQSINWGDIGGTLSTQSDLYSELSSKINGGTIGGSQSLNVSSGGIMEIPILTSSTYGAAKFDPNYGITQVNTSTGLGQLKVVDATNTNIDARKAAGTSGFGVITTDNLDYATRAVSPYVTAITSSTASVSLTDATGTTNNHSTRYTWTPAIGISPIATLPSASSSDALEHSLCLDVDFTNVQTITFKDSSNNTITLEKTITIAAGDKYRFICVFMFGAWHVFPLKVS